MSEDAEDDKRPWRWRGVWRATLIGALVGVAAAAAVEYYDAPRPKQPASTAVQFTRSRGVHLVSLESQASPWILLPLAGASIGFLQRICRNNWRW